MYSFARRPRWIISHVLVVLLTLTLANLGLWQISRHGERADRNDVVEARSQAAPVSWNTAFDGIGEVADAEYRAVQVTGSYVDATLLIDNRSMDGLPGVWAVGFLDIGDERIVPVVRGFARRVGNDLDVPAPPAGEVTVEGTVQLYVERGCGTRPGDDGRIVGAACLSAEVAAQASTDSTYTQPAAIRLDASDPAESDLRPVPLPELGAGPHLGYAGQWFIFMMIAVVGYPLVLRSVARRQAAPDSAGVTNEARSTLVP